MPTPVLAGGGVSAGCVGGVRRSDVEALVGPYVGTAWVGSELVLAYASTKTGPRLVLTRGPRLVLT